MESGGLCWIEDARRGACDGAGKRRWPDAIRHGGSVPNAVTSLVLALALLQKPMSAAEDPTLRERVIFHWLILCLRRVAPLQKPSPEPPTKARTTIIRRSPHSKLGSIPGDENRRRGDADTGFELNVTRTYNLIHCSRRPRGPGPCIAR